MDVLLVAIIVGLAVAFSVRGAVRALSGNREDPCGCGCKACGQASTCIELKKREPGERDLPVAGPH
ncbi:MAG: FeoB-associated Cys-rich membrane protein [Desulfobacterales bacterium]